jgi:predicted nucleotidyltransferase
MRAPNIQLNVQQTIDEAVRRVVERFDPIRVVLFGSGARGTMGPDSDLDLFVEMDSNQRFIDRCAAVRLALRDLQIPIDVFVYTPAEVAEQRGRLGNLLAYIDGDGKVVYERL